MLNAILEYHRVERNINKSLANVNKDATVKRETEYYKTHIDKIKTPEDLLKNFRLYRYIMQAHDLTEYIFAKGMVKKMLTDSDYASRVKDIRFQKLCENFNFIVFKDKTTSMLGAAVETVDRYKEMALEQKTGLLNVNAQKGLYFNRVIKEAFKNKKLKETSWPYVILQDQILTEFMFKSAGISDVSMATSVDAKAKLLKNHFKLTDLADDKIRDRMITKALAKYDCEDDDLGDMSSGSIALQILGGSSSDDFLSIVSALPRGGF